MRLIALLAVLLVGVCPLAAQVKDDKPKVEVSGDVFWPQRLNWSPDLTLALAIGNCSGAGPFSRGRGIRLLRDGRVIGIYNLAELQKDPSKDPKLRPGDQVIVP
ncbi:hypothetical protein CfE428DRAFT_6116 [Chthoniobacter flavus Ellin428]|uniref:Polysaccharide export protein n=1 Tax=Chthoniobacter flavus Ellin428 TaxID=497964 RepID=B4DB25_9BACT|nr:hypothetical protein [Chthoniobacter flavus]EDY16399.1 hypothetical protein CfE428DRAFT_6116 [Chthoniobacter flavus Ellin428]TCO92487.1 hypothetical protein EV701_106257 [Chthoniobacter flavus]